MGPMSGVESGTLGLGNVECGDIVGNRGQVAFRGFAVVEQVFGFEGAQQVCAKLGFVEVDRERITHVGHEREVEKLGEVEFILQPTCVRTTVLL